MNIYVDYNFYKSEYGGKLEEAAFNKAALLATQYIRSITLLKADNYSGVELKYAVCEISELYAKDSDNFSDASMAAQSGKEIKSISNAGFSVTYTSEGKEGETSETLINRKAYAILKKWLLTTGLLNPVVNKCNCGDCYG